MVYVRLPAIASMESKLYAMAMPVSTPAQMPADKAIVAVKKAPSWYERTTSEILRVRCEDWNCERMV